MEKIRNTETQLNERQEIRKRRSALNRAIDGFLKATVVAGSLVGNPSTADAQTTNNSVQHGLRFESQEKSKPIAYVDRKIFKNSSSERKREIANVRALLKDPNLTREQFEGFLEASLQTADEITKRPKFDAHFKVIGPEKQPDAVAISVPDGMRNSFGVVNGKEQFGNRSEVIYFVDGHPYVCEITALHTIPPASLKTDGWMYIASDKGMGDFAVRCLREATKADNLPVFTGKQTTDSLIGVYGTNIVQPQKPTKDENGKVIEVPYQAFSSMFFPMELLRKFYTFDTRGFQERFGTRLNFDAMTTEGGVCQVLPFQSFEDRSKKASETGSAQERNDFDIYTSGGYGMIVGEGGKLSEVVAVQSFVWKVGTDRADGGIHVVCNVSSEQMSATFGKAAASMRRAS